MLQRLSNFNAVMIELGGCYKVAQLVGRSPSAVSHWRDRMLFPRIHYFVMEEQLRVEHKCYAPKSLWGFEEARNEAAA